jgi:ParB/RepB/Spo0J family partition protein
VIQVDRIACVPVAEIVVGERHRRDLGDLDALLDSIRDLGFLQPIVVRPDKRLVAGARLAAARKLGVETIPAIVIDGLTDAVNLLKVERDENTCRKQFTPSEAVSIGKALEELERPRARQRQTASLQKGDPSPVVESFHNGNGKTRDKVGEAVGMSGKTYEKAKAVVEAAQSDPVAFGAIAERVDENSKVDRAYKQMVQKQKLLARDAQAALVEGDHGIITGDMREIGRTIADGSIDLIFTDPPYLAEFIHLYEDLAKFAARVLRPGGVCLTYCGNLFVAHAHGLMARHLKFMHTFGVRHTAGTTIIRSAKVWNTFKPILGFCKPPLEPWWETFDDMPPPCGREKSDHEWQQARGEAEHFIKNLCPPRGIVCDPFTGSGTTCVAAARLGRRYVAFEIDPQTAARARARVQEETAAAASGGKAAPREESNGPFKSRGKGVDLAHEAINVLSRIPKNDGLRERGFRIVLDWLKSQLKESATRKAK